MPDQQQYEFSDERPTEGQELAEQRQERIKESLRILKLLGLKRFLNEMSALCLLGLVDLRPNMTWAEASSPLIGITPLMDFAKEQYDKPYAPNTREVFRDCIDQFIELGLIVKNPDKVRPVNSPNTVYQIEPTLLELLQQYYSDGWREKLKTYLGALESLVEKYKALQDAQQVPILNDSEEPIYISPGDHSLLIKAIVEEFRKNFSPKSEVIYIGDTGAKWGVYREEVFKELGLNPDPHGKMPDVILFDREKSWLLLIEAVVSSGEFDAKRQKTFQQLFKSNKVGLVFVTAFPTIQFAAGFLSRIAWKSEVWTLDNPEHLIHLDGERFLGPYE